MTNRTFMRSSVKIISLLLLMLTQPAFGANSPLQPKGPPNANSGTGTQTVQGSGSGSTASQGATASGSLESMSADSGQAAYSTFGKTWIKVPQTIWNIQVSKNDVVTSSKGPFSYVRHIDNSTPCRTVSSVEVDMLNPDNSHSSYECIPNTCSFDFNQCAIFTAPILDEKQYLTLCRTPERSKNAWSGKVPLNALTLRIRYSNGMSDVLTQLYTDVNLTCEAVSCIPLNLMQFDKDTYAWLPKGYIGRPYNAQLYIGGHKTTVTKLAIAGKPGLPPGLQLDSTGRIYGVPSEYSRGEWKIDFDIKDGCPWNGETRKGTATLKIADTVPPALKEVILTPRTLPYSGGEVVLQVKASDNIAVFHVTANQTKPDGSQGAASAPLVSGTPADGVWRLKWNIWANTRATPQKYMVKVKVDDSDGNVVESLPITITVEAKGTAPKFPVAPSLPALQRPAK